MIFLLRMLYPWAMSSADHDRSSSAFGIVVGYKKKIVEGSPPSASSSLNMKGKK